MELGLLHMQLKITKHEYNRTAPYYVMTLFAVHTFHTVQHSEKREPTTGMKAECCLL